MKKTIKRCALYTRKSSEEGLDQDFNSLDAQREACAAYVKSQKHEGWRAIDTQYNDGGFSGGTMERPALQKLLTDIAAGKVDVVVVYKIDRLTRALTDFARMVDIFDRHDVSFVSVTQSFNTTSSMGRLTLNVLLSFAQFEREVTGERIRDKIAASKAKGMWMGGTPPLGYDLPDAGSRALVVNPSEAETVRLIFRTYLELGPVHELERWLAARGIRSKSRINKSGKILGGKPLGRGPLYHLLRNRTYRGMIVHKEQVHPGQHPAIVDADLFDAVQARLEDNTRRRDARQDPMVRAPLTGRIFDADGQPMTPTLSYGKGGKPYRYYISTKLQRGRRRHEDDDAIRRVPALAVESMLAEVVARLVPRQSSEPLGLLTRVEIHARSVEILMPVTHLTAVRRRLKEDEHAEKDPADPSQLRLTLAVRIARRGGRTAVVTSKPSEIRPDPALINALRAAHAMVGCDAAGLPIIEKSPVTAYQRRLVRLAFLAPDLQRAILEGRQPPDLTVGQLMDGPVPLLWTEQVEVFSAGTDV